MADNAARQIISIGGGGFLMREDNLVQERYVLSQARVQEPAVAFLATATGDDSANIVRFYATFSALECRPSHLPLFASTPDLRSYLLSQDVIFVGGGNTKSMLAVWRDWGIPELLREAWESGIVLAGMSAGAICWFEQALVDSFASGLTVIDGLAFLSGSCCAHYGTADRRATYTDLVSRGEIAPGYGIDDSVSIHFVDDKIFKTVASQPDAHAYHVRRGDAGVNEVTLDMEYIGLPISSGG